MKKNRGKKLSSFGEVYRRGSFLGYGVCGMIFYNNNHQGLRWGIAVNAKKWNRAVERNRIKRVFREAVYPLLPFIKDNLDIIFIFRGKKEDIISEKIQKDIRMILNRKKIL